MSKISGCTISLQAAVHLGASATRTQHQEKKKNPWTDPEGSRRLRLPHFMTIRHMKVVRLSALHIGRLYPQEIFLVFVLVRG
jgi:hypothetical protein